MSIRLNNISSSLLRKFSSVSIETHPIVDCKPLLDGKLLPETLDRMKEALKERGYFYASNCSVMDKDYIDKVYAYHDAVHSLPITTKREFAAPKGSYTGLDLGSEYAEDDYEPGTLSSVRAWDYSRHRHREHESPKYPEKDILDVGFAEFVDDLYARQNILGSALMKAFAVMLGLPEGIFEKSFNDGDMGTIRLLYYPGHNPENEMQPDMGISAHTDFEVFTLMHQNAPGLQFLMPGNSSEWIDAPVADEFVVIVGDVIERYTNGELKATPHRVLQLPHQRRSIIRFNALHPEALIQPLPQFISPENPPRYTPVKMKTHMRTTIENLRQGKGAWDPDTQTSKTATYVYDKP